MTTPDNADRGSQKFHNQYEIDSRLTRNKHGPNRNTSPCQGPLKMSDLFNKQPNIKDQAQFSKVLSQVKLLENKQSQNLIKTLKN